MTQHLKMTEVVTLSERLGMTPEEWLFIRNLPTGGPQPPRPLTAEQWREALMSTIEVYA